MTIQKIDLVPEAIASEIGTMSPQEIDLLPFGTIHVDLTGTVLGYNSAEEKIANRSRKNVVGRNFFKDVAPCTRVRQFHGAFEEGVKRKSLNEVFDFTFRFPTGTKEVRIRMIYTEMTTASVWIFVTPLSG